MVHSKIAYISSTYVPLVGSSSRPVRMFVLLLCCVGLAEDGSRSADSLIMRGIDILNSSYNEWDNGGFQKAARVFGRAADQENTGGLAEYWIGTSLFFQAIYHLYTPDKAPEQIKGKSYIDRGIEVLGTAVARKPDFSESYAVRGVLRGMKISMNPVSVFTQGPLVGKDRDKALALNAGNPRVHFLTGVSFWYSPRILGNYGKALPHFLTADTLFEKESRMRKDPLYPRWGRSMNAAFIGEVYFAEEEYTAAKNYYQAALAVNESDSLAKRGMEKINELNRK